jgi:hypothetical protein
MNGAVVSLLDAGGNTVYTFPAIANNNNGSTLTLDPTTAVTDSGDSALNKIIRLLEF